jgi:flavodoxin
MDGEKVLVAFYSRTGTTKGVAEELAKSLGCESEEIIDTKSRSGFFGILSAGWSAMFRRLTVIEEVKKNPEKYELVVVGTPIWAGRAASAARTYLSQYRDRFKRVAFFCTCGDPNQKGAFEDMAELCGKEPEAVLAVTAKQAGKEEANSEIRDFSRQLSAEKQAE